VTKSGSSDRQGDHLAFISLAISKKRRIAEAEWMRAVCDRKIPVHKTTASRSSPLRTSNSRPFILYFFKMKCFWVDRTESSGRDFLGNKLGDA
jgi:hypothetical protein